MENRVDDLAINKVFGFCSQILIEHEQIYAKQPCTVDPNT